MECISSWLRQVYMTMDLVVTFQTF